MNKEHLSPRWKMVRFGDVVRQVKDRVVREETGLQYYLGGEHFNKASIHVNGRGVISENPIGPAFHMRFKPGQVLLVSRNPHLRKASIAEFEGICANTTYVCQADGKYLLQELLPFLMQTDDFWTHAEANKRGSTNPYLNWGDFARFEFPLPPLDEQKRIAEILWAADEAVEKYKSASNAITNVFEATKKAHFGREHNAHFRDVLRLASGKSKTKKQQFDFSSENPVPVYGGNGITGYTSEVLVDGPVVVVGRVGEYCGAVHLSDENCWVTDNAIYVKEHSPGIETSYLYYALIYANLNSQKRIAGQPLINQEIIESSTLYLPSIDKQREVLSLLSEIKQRKEEIEVHISKTALMLKTLGGIFTQIGAAHV